MSTQSQIFWKLLNQAVHKLDTIEIRAPFTISWYPSAHRPLQETLEYEINRGSVIVGDTKSQSILILSIDPEGKKYSKRLGSRTSAQNRSNLRDSYSAGQLQRDFISPTYDLLSTESQWFEEHHIVQMYSILVSLHRQCTPTTTSDSTPTYEWPLQCPRTKRNGMHCELGECHKCANYAVCGWRDPRISRLIYTEKGVQAFIEWT